MRTHQKTKKLVDVKYKSCLRQITTQLALNNLVIFNGTTFYPILKSRNVSRDLIFFFLFFFSSSRYSSPLKCLVLFIVLLNCCLYYTKFIPNLFIFKFLNVSRDFISFSFHFLFFSFFILLDIRSY